MRTKTTRMISSVILLMILVLGGLLFLYYSPEGQNTAVPCYDNYNREVLGATCLYNQWDSIRELTRGLLALGFFFIMVYIILVKGDVV